MLSVLGVLFLSNCGSSGNVALTLVNYSTNAAGNKIVFLSLSNGLDKPIQLQGAMSITTMRYPIADEYPATVQPNRVIRLCVEIPSNTPPQSYRVFYVPIEEKMIVLEKFRKFIRYYFGEPCTEVYLP